MTGQSAVRTTRSGDAAHEKRRHGALPAHAHRDEIRLMRGRRLDDSPRRAADQHVGGHFLIRGRRALEFALKERCQRDAALV